MDLTKVEGFEKSLESAKIWTASDHLYMKAKVSPQALKMIEDSSTMKREIHDILKKETFSAEEKEQAILSQCAIQWGSFYFPQVKEIPWNVHRSLDALAEQVGEEAFKVYTTDAHWLIDASKAVHEAQVDLHKEGKLFGEMDAATGKYAVSDLDLKKLGFSEKALKLAEEFKKSKEVASVPVNKVDGATLFATGVAGALTAPNASPGYGI